MIGLRTAAGARDRARACRMTVVVPYWNWYVVGCAFAFTDADTVAVVVVIAEAAPVTAAGGVNDWAASVREACRRRPA